MIDPIKSLSSTFAREVGITSRGLGNVAIVLAPVFAVAALTSGDSSGLSNGLNAIMAGGCVVGGIALRKVGNMISNLSSQPL
jgi:hypothetical protein